MPSMPEYEPLPAPEPLPPLPPIAPPPELSPAEKQQQQMANTMPSPRQAAPMPVAPPPAPYSPPPMAPTAPIVTPVTAQAPPPQLANPAQESGIVKRRKSKRKELQQAAGGTDALRIRLDKSSGIGTAKKGTGSTGLNIPK